MNKKANLKLFLLIAFIVLGIPTLIMTGIYMYKLDVFEPSPAKIPTGFNEFYLEDYKITSEGNAILVLTNQDKNSRTVTLNRVTVDDNECTGDTGDKAVDEFWIIECSDLQVNSEGSTYKGVQVSIEYTVSSIDYLETGNLNGRYE